jgi:hypothetical protein
MTPDQVHYGQADEVHAARQKTTNQPPPGSTRQPNGYESKLKFKYRLSQRFHGEWIATDSLAE